MSLRADEVNESNGHALPPENAQSHKPSLLRLLSAAAFALGFLVLATRFLPSGTSSMDENARVERPPRQRVIIFLIDTIDDVDIHGTHVHSVLRQYCPRCEVQAINLRGDLTLSSVIHALHQVHTQSQTIDPATTVLVNLSLGTYTYDKGLHTAVRTLEASGMVLIASAGNDNTARPFYPAAFREVLGVCSSTRHTRVKAAYSNFGNWVSLCAPGLQHVSRPLQHGELASGTSLATPMIAGVLGQLLLEAPCASPRAGTRALLRTADPVDESGNRLGAGILNPTAAHHYLRSLYACNAPNTPLQRLLRYANRLGTRAGLTLGVVVYFLLSICTIPFLLAFGIEHVQRHATYRRQQVFQQAYMQSATYRRHRLLALRHHFLHTHRIRRQQRVELFALLCALHRHGEACWWCDAPPTQLPPSSLPLLATMACSRCGMEKPG